MYSNITWVSTQMWVLCWNIITDISIFNSCIKCGSREVYYNILIHIIYEVPCRVINTTSLPKTGGEGGGDKPRIIPGKPLLQEINSNWWQIDPIVPFDPGKGSGLSLLEWPHVLAINLPFYPQRLDEGAKSSRTPWCITSSQTKRATLWQRTCDSGQMNTGPTGPISYCTSPWPLV